MAWTVTSEARYFAKFLGTETTVNGTASFNSDAITAGTATSDTVNPSLLLGDQSVYLGVQITVACLDVTADLVLQHSPDNSTWFTESTLIADCTPDSTGYKLVFKDLAGKHAPYWRLVFNGTGTALGSSGKFRFFVCALNPMSLSQMMVP